MPHDCICGKQLVGKISLQQHGDSSSQCIGSNVQMEKMQSEASLTTALAKQDQKFMGAQENINRLQKKQRLHERELNGLRSAAATLRAMFNDADFSDTLFVLADGNTDNKVVSLDPEEAASGTIAFSCHASVVGNSASGSLVLATMLSSRSGFAEVQQVTTASVGGHMAGVQARQGKRTVAVPVNPVCLPDTSTTETSLRCFLATFYGYSLCESLGVSATPNRRRMIPKKKATLSLSSFSSPAPAPNSLPTTTLQNRLAPLGVQGDPRLPSNNPSVPYPLLPPPLPPFYSLRAELQEGKHSNSNKNSNTLNMNNPPTSPVLIAPIPAPYPKNPSHLQLPSLISVLR